MPQTPEEESLGSLVAQATDHISTLVRSEIELAKAEFRFDAKRVGMAGGMFAAAAFMAHLCLILLSFTIAFVIAEWLPTWAAFLIVTVFYLLVAGLLVFIGARRLKGLTKMKRTTRSLKGLKEISHPDEPSLPLDDRPVPVKRPVTSDGT
ncbi:phage holin family protein [Nonomuraea sp. MCN248]|uniref:Phage holin family protein n=1 Tax=Nonomuraea corallina TaxID=2989783 RepID=A0ABT4S8Q9_9ACTN|nr:phage holin family protein [Nonomuraea corallina]MDA0633612.1 phage holin family protein [Nonomuraea corallina]